MSARTAGATLAVEVAGIRCANPVWAASGCCNYGRELGRLYPLRELGGICVKGTSLTPWSGNPGTRVAETPCGMLNAIGLQNPGVEHFLEYDLPWLHTQGATVIVNVVGRTLEEYAEVARRVSTAPSGWIAGMELNISCPNVKEGGLQFGTDRIATAEVVAAVRGATPLPLIVKLSPNVTDLVPFAAAAAESGADALSLINTVLGMDMDLHACRPTLAIHSGGLSGPAIRPIALRWVWEVSQAVPIPVIGIGGIQHGTDAAAFFLAGAQAVQVGTAIFRDPWAPLRIRDELQAWLSAQGLPDVKSAVGLGRPRAARQV